MKLYILIDIYIYIYIYIYNNKKRDMLSNNNTEPEILENTPYCVANK